MKDLCLTVSLLVMVGLYAVLYPITNSLLSSPSGLQSSDILWSRIIFACTAFNITSFLLRFRKNGREIFPLQWKETWVYFLAAALFMPCLSQWALFEGIKYTSSVNASIMRVIAPMIIFILAVFIFKQETFNKKNIIGILLASASAILLILNNATSQVKASFYGDSMVFLSTLSFSFYAIIAKVLISRYKVHPIHVLAYTFNIGLVILIFVASAKILPPFSVKVFLNLDTAAWIYVAIILIGSTFLAFSIDIWVLKFKPTYTVATFSCLIPVFTAVISYVWFGEYFPSVVTVLLGLLVLLGVLIVIYNSTPIIWSIWSLLHTRLKHRGPHIPNLTVNLKGRN